MDTATEPLLQPPLQIPRPPARDNLQLVERAHAPDTWTRHEFPKSGEEDHAPGWLAWFTEDGKEVPAGWEDANGVVLWADPRTQRLVHPIKLGANAEPLRELHYMPMRGKHMRTMPVGRAMQVGDMMNLAAVLTTQPALVFDRMHPEDTGEVVQRVSGFLGGGPGTGAESGPT